jgi:hypothetical protein
VIRYHYHTAQRDIPRLEVKKGDTLVHAYSDTSIEELIEWGRSHGLKAEWIDRRNALPHYDLFGPSVEWAGEGVTRAELVADLRMWRERRTE